MARHVGQGLLADAEQRGRKLLAGIEILHALVAAEDSGSLPKVFGKPFDGGYRAEGIEDARTQLGGDAPDIPYGRVHQPGQLGEPLQQRTDRFGAGGGGPQAVLQIDQVEPQRGDATGVEGQRGVFDGVDATCCCKGIELAEGKELGQMLRLQNRDGLARRTRHIGRLG